MTEYYHLVLTNPVTVIIGIVIWAITSIGIYKELSDTDAGKSNYLAFVPVFRFIPIVKAFEGPSILYIAGVLLSLFTLIQADISYVAFVLSRLVSGYTWYLYVENYYEETEYAWIIGALGIFSNFFVVCSLLYARED